jgi:AbrB family looped-hinge helix DNA binding protein
VGVAELGQDRTFGPTGKAGLEGNGAELSGGTAVYSSHFAYFIVTSATAPTLYSITFPPDKEKLIFVFVDILDEFVYTIGNTVYTLREKIIMTTATVSKKGWVVIPKNYRQKYNIKPGDEVRIIDYGGVLVVVPMPEDSITALRGMLADGPSLTADLLADRQEAKQHEETQIDQSHRSG